MICRTCLQRASYFLGRRAALPISRSFSRTAAVRSAAPPVVDTPTLTDPLTRPGDATTTTTDAAAPALSSCPAGTVLNGLNYFKGGQDPVAKADDEYPAWLWSCLDVQKKAADESAEDLGDEFSKSKKQRRLAAKRQRQLEAQVLATGNIEALAPKIPLQQQSVNLPVADEASGATAAEDAMFAAAKREELRRAMRKERKAKIKESNYLKSM